MLWHLALKSARCPLFTSSQAASTPSLSPHTPHLRHVPACHPGGSGQTFQRHSRLSSFQTQGISEPHGGELPPPTSSRRPATCHQPPAKATSPRADHPWTRAQPPCPAPTDARLLGRSPHPALRTKHRDPGLSPRHADRLGLQVRHAWRLPAAGSLGFQAA